MNNEVLFTVSAGKSEYKIVSGSDFNIRFVPNRYQLLCQYAALNKTKTNLLRYLFPTDNRNFNNILQKGAIKLNNISIEKNPEQLQAILQICNDGWSNKCPYIILGPPGTGKTTTIVECIVQLVSNSENNRILVTAPSNSACDEITMRLRKILYKGYDQKPLLLRIYSQTYRD
uniref:DNA2/NAM7 helicase helicase domain-containing protein n=1 Tax=Megaselia scalaris TaxID=36166 RepID=T1H1M1_MEGSC